MGIVLKSGMNNLILCPQTINNNFFNMQLNPVRANRDSTTIKLNDKMQQKNTWKILIDTCAYSNVTFISKTGSCTMKKIRWFTPML